MIPNPTWNMGSGVSQTNPNSQWNPVYKVFHRICCCKTKRFVSSNVSVILARQTCGQRSSTSARSKRQALDILFLWANLPYVPNIQMYRTLPSRFVHFWGICEKRTAVQCQTSIFPRQFLRFSNRKKLTNPLHPMLFIPDSDILLPCWNSQSLHLYTGGVSRFTTQAMTLTGSFHTFIVHGPLTGSKTVQIWPKLE